MINWTNIDIYKIYFEVLIMLLKITSGYSFPSN